MKDCKNCKHHCVGDYCSYYVQKNCYSNNNSNVFDVAKNAKTCRQMRDGGFFGLLKGACGGEGKLFQRRFDNTMPSRERQNLLFLRNLIVG